MVIWRARLLLMAALVAGWLPSSWARRLVAALRQSIDEVSIENDRLRRSNDRLQQMIDWRQPK